MDCKTRQSIALKPFKPKTFKEVVKLKKKEEKELTDETFTR